MHCKVFLSVSRGAIPSGMEFFFRFSLPFISLGDKTKGRDMRGAGGVGVKGWVGGRFNTPFLPV